jgi:acetyl esterase/lipase
MLAGTAGVEEFEGDGGNHGVPTHVAAAVGVYPPTLISHEERARGGVHGVGLMGDAGSAETAAAASPLSYASPGFPPTMLIHGTADTTVPPLASVAMYEALVKAGVPVELHMYSEQPHAFDRQREFGRQCAAEMRLFLDRYVTNPTAGEPAASTPVRSRTSA